MILLVGIIIGILVTFVIMTIMAYKLVQEIEQIHREEIIYYQEENKKLRQKINNEL